ncbi:trypsin-like peptidase domain-containing protein [Thermodesulfobacteriota bacterium]
MCYREEFRYISMFRSIKGRIECSRTPVVVCLLFLSLLVYTDLSTGTERTVAIAQKVKRCVVFVLAHKNEEVKGRATGFFINKTGCFVSNHHVMGEEFMRNNGITHLTVVTQEDKKYKVDTVLAEDREADVAVACVELEHGKTVPFLKLRAKLPLAGQHVMVVGHPLGLGWSVSDGIVSAIRVRDGAKYIQFTAPVTSGSSGSPVVDLWGRVVGVNSRFELRKALDSRAQLNLASASENVLQLRLNDGKTVGHYLYKDYLADLEATVADMLKRATTKRQRAQAKVRLGLGYVNLNRYRRASLEFEEAVRADPGHADAHYLLGLTYLELGRKRLWFERCKILTRIDKGLAEKLRRATPPR